MNDDNLLGSNLLSSTPLVDDDCLLLNNDEAEEENNDSMILNLLDDDEDAEAVMSANPCITPKTLTAADPEQRTHLKLIYMSPEVL